MNQRSVEYCSERDTTRYTGVRVPNQREVAVHREQASSVYILRSQVNLVKKTRSLSMATIVRQSDLNQPLNDL